MTDRPETLLIDYAGVYTVPIVGAVVDFCTREGIDPAVLATTVGEAYSDDAGDSDIHALERGSLAVEEFDRRLGARLGVDPERLTRRMFATLVPDPEMVALVKRLRARGVLVGLLSNSWGGAEGYERAALDDQFDAVALSGELGVRKPEPEIFALAAERMGLEPAQIVFVDDFQVNVDGAQAAGLHALLHTDAPTTIARVDDLLRDEV